MPNRHGVPHVPTIFTYRQTFIHSEQNEDCHHRFNIVMMIIRRSSSASAIHGLDSSPLQAAAVLLLDSSSFFVGGHNNALMCVSSDRDLPDSQSSTFVICYKEIHSHYQHLQEAYWPTNRPFVRSFIRRSLKTRKQHELLLSGNIKWFVRSYPPKKLFTGLHDGLSACPSVCMYDEGAEKAWSV